MMRKISWIGTVCAALLFNSDPVRANPMDAFGLGGRGPAMANAQIAAADDFSGVYYNPATLFNVPVGDGIDTFALSSVNAVDRLHIRNLNRYDQTFPLVNTYNIAMGMTDGIGTDWFRVGLNFQLPIRRLQLQGTHFVDEREAFFSDLLRFEFYGQRFQRQIVLPAVAFRPHRSIAFGAGVSLFTFSRTDTDVYQTDLAEVDKAFINLRGDQQNTSSMEYGLLWELKPDIRFGLVYRDAESFVIRGVSQVELEDLRQELGQALDFRIQFRPTQAGGGLAYDYSDRLKLAGDLMWYRWSRYRDTHNNLPSPRFQDTLSPRLGAEYLMPPDWVFRGGYAFEPSPVPEQIERTNYVDNDKNVLSAGAGYRIQADGYRVSFDLFAQVHLMVDRTTRKKLSREELQTTTLLKDSKVDRTHDNPGWPGFESGGEVYAFGLTFSLMR